MISCWIQMYGKLKTDTSNFVSLKYSERTRHLDLDAKHSPMHGWLLPWGARRLRFNGDTEGMTLSVCILPSLHTTSRLLPFYLILSSNKIADAFSYKAMPTFKFGHANIFTHTHTSMCACHKWLYAHARANLHTLIKTLTKALLQAGGISCKLKLLSRLSFCSMKNGIGLKSVGSALNMSGKANVTEGNALI